VKNNGNQKMHYFKLLEIFLLKLLFKKDEYKINNKNFNPIKVIIITILLLISLIGIKSLVNLNKLYKLVEKECPKIIEKITKK